MSIIAESRMFLKRLISCQSFSIIRSWCILKKNLCYAITVNTLKIRQRKISCHVNRKYLLFPVTKLFVVMILIDLVVNQVTPEMKNWILFKWVINYVNKMKDCKNEIRNYQKSLPQCKNRWKKASYLGIFTE